jgi:excisionase family DNA binding protein
MLLRLSASTEVDMTTSGIHGTEKLLGAPSVVSPEHNTDDYLDFRIERALRKLGLLVADSWLTPAEAAKHARLSKSHLLRVCRQGRGPEYAGEGKLMRFRKSAVDRWLAASSAQTI